MAPLKLSSNFLSADRKIAVIAPAAPVNDGRLTAGINNLREVGFEVTPFGKLSEDEQPEHSLFFSDSAPARARALELAFNSASIIWCAKGGYGSMELLPLINFEKLNIKGKVLVGFSDVTALLVAFAAKTEVLAVHGPTIESGWSKVESDAQAKESVKRVMDLLEGNNNAICGALTSLNGRNTTIEGEVTGGNLSMLAALLGTPYEPDFNGKILFFEEIGEKPYKIHRLLTQLKLAGKLSALKGVLIGHLTDCGHPSGIGATATESILDIFKESEVPVYSGGPFGHETLNFPLPFGVPVRVSAAGCFLI